MSAGRKAEKIVANKSRNQILFEIPCFTCENLERCGLGQEHSSLECKCLTNWLKKKLEEEED